MRDTSELVEVKKIDGRQHVRHNANFKVMQHMTGYKGVNCTWRESYPGAVEGEIGYVYTNRTCFDNFMETEGSPGECNDTLI